MGPEGTAGFEGTQLGAAGVEFDANKLGEVIAVGIEVVGLNKVSQLGARVHTLPASRNKAD